MANSIIPKYNWKRIAYVSHARAAAKALGIRELRIQLRYTAPCDTPDLVKAIWAEWSIADADSNYASQLEVKHGSVLPGTGDWS